MRPDTKHSEKKTEGMHALKRNGTAQAFSHLGVFFSLLDSVNPYTNRLYPEASTEPAPSTQ